MRVLSKRGILVLLLAVVLMMTNASPCIGAVGAVRIEGADRYETCARTAAQAY